MYGFEETSWKDNKFRYLTETEMVEYILSKDYSRQEYFKEMDKKVSSGGYDDDCFDDIMRGVKFWD